MGVSCFCLNKLLSQPLEPAYLLLKFVMSKEFISTHVLDTARGIPAEGLVLKLFRNLNMTEQGDDENDNYVWESIAEVVTNHDGRARFDFDIETGVYKVNFYTKDYFQKLGTPHFYPKIEIIFRIANPLSHHHIPLLLSPYGYSTYRGS